MRDGPLVSIEREVLGWSEVLRRGTKTARADS